MLSYVPENTKADWRVRLFFATIGIMLLAGCGTIKGRAATDQLLLSDAVDRTISQVDFKELSGAKVYLDSSYIKGIRTGSFVNCDYIVSSLRELLIRDGCHLQDASKDAEYVIEVRVGALGTDNHEINYGVPGNAAINQTASIISSAPIPTIPEISLAKRDDTRAAAKISLYAYRRETKQPVWQTGTIVGHSHAKSTWVLGAGPFNQGSIYEQSDLRTSPVEMPHIPHIPRVEELSQSPIKFVRIRQLMKPKSEWATSQPAGEAGPDRFSRAAIQREELNRVANEKLDGDEASDNVALVTAEAPVVEASTPGKSG